MLNSNKRFELWDFFRENIEPRTFVDLTHTFQAGQPHFSAFPDEQTRLLFDFSLGNGFQVHHYSHVGQWGTHVDPPVHFVEGGRSLDELPVKEMILPLAVLDITAKVAASPDAVPGLEDVASWEAKYGPIPANSFVALRTDWYKRWPNAEAMGNKDAEGILHSPGWSKEVLELLFEERKVTAVGHEQTDTDPGQAISRQDYGLEYYVLAQDRWQIELMANLDKVPEAGALIVAAWPRPKGGSGYPARVFAIC